MDSRAPLSAAPFDGRWPVLAGLGAVILACWAYLLSTAGPSVPMTDGMAGMPGMAAMQAGPAAWHPAALAALAIMWIAMMAAMMLPSATPMILLYAAIARQARARGEHAASTALFALGYLAVWTGFALVATFGQTTLSHTAQLDPRATLISRIAAGALLIAAGLYQLTPWKQTCLRHCRSPMSFVITHWQGGRGGALRMGVLHGAFCLGCCWCLMLLLFVGGVMNLWWIVGLTVFVMVEKSLPGSVWIERASAAVLIGWGVLTLARAI